MRLAEFNGAHRSDAVELLRPCLDIRRWYEQVADARPYADREAVLRAAREAAHPFTADEVATAMSHHPRIGEKSNEGGAVAAHSRAEQAGVDTTDAATQAALADGNRAYEQKFDRVFLIRAAGRTSQQILAALTERLGHSAAEEDTIVAEQLREIALLRLEGLITA
ncbi:2-oxo-4-hydroxy-4-carboxy-5-ureidoimidazoline decarboxylase [Rathayibacter soli]|uniref:2-oxo-4-hydroxy-4-carboxy-5-ureidoimidazoline decarboxylase n=1 Tax=Rathayibacter soli TaxID=3144168 RepID=UPI0027E46126|nr:2-oxo-4-hydroxy-4-carboxy-5-ureidoimidazoline decarboxylase [Glaciibacter superstes]